MKLIINARRIKSKAKVILHIHQRVRFAFSRTRDYVQSLAITLADINGPKGGIDKQCKVFIKLRSCKDIVIVERQSKLKHAVDRAITRASHNLTQQIKRKQTRKLRARTQQLLPLAD